MAKYSSQLAAEMGKKSEVGGAECCHALLFCQETQRYYVTKVPQSRHRFCNNKQYSEKAGNLIFFSNVHIVELSYSKK